MPMNSAAAARLEVDFATASLDATFSDIATGPTTSCRRIRSS